MSAPRETSSSALSDIHILHELLESGDIDASEAGRIYDSLSPIDPEARNRALIDAVVGKFEGRDLSEDYTNVNADRLLLIYGDPKGGNVRYAVRLEARKPVVGLTRYDSPGENSQGMKPLGKYWMMDSFRGHPLTLTVLDYGSYTSMRIDPHTGGMDNITHPIPVREIFADFGISLPA